MAPREGLAIWYSLWEHECPLGVLQQCGSTFMAIGHSRAAAVFLRNRAAEVGS